ncbi:MAG: hypothetical protein ACOC4R_00985 [Bacteroidota bacterium]
MKTTTFTLLTILFLAAAASVNAGNPQLGNEQVKPDDEPYVNDVPFNTEIVLAGIDGDQKERKSNTFEVQLNEEGYVDDVDFDTRQVVINYLNSLLQQAGELARALNKNYEMISVSPGNNLQNHNNYDVQLAPEPYVDDVPFDTNDIAKID